MKRIRIIENPAFLATAGKYLLTRGAEKVTAKAKKKLEKKKLYQRYLKVKHAYKDFESFKKAEEKKREAKLEKMKAKLDETKPEQVKEEKPAVEEAPKEESEPVSNPRRYMYRGNSMRRFRNPMNRDEKVLDRIDEYLEAIGDTDGDNWYPSVWEHGYEGLKELRRDKNRNSDWFDRANSLKEFLYYQMTRILQRYGTSYEEWKEEREDW